MIKASKKPAPVQTEQTLTDAAMVKLRKANEEAAQREAQKEKSPDSGFTPEAAGFSAQAWASLSFDARLYAANCWIEKRREELKKAKAKAEAENAQQ